MGHATVLIVEDNKPDAELTWRALSQWRRPPAVHVAETAKEALAYLADASHRLSLIILDGSVPGGSETVTEAARLDVRHHDVPIVVFSGTPCDRLPEEVVSRSSLCLEKSTDVKRVLEELGDIERLIDLGWI